MHFLLGMQAKVQAILDRWTQALANKLNTNIDTTISSRASSTNLQTVDTNVDTILTRVPAPVASSAALTVVDAAVDSVAADVIEQANVSPVPVGGFITLGANADVLTQTVSGDRQFLRTGAIVSSDGYLNGDYMRIHPVNETSVMQQGVSSASGSGLQFVRIGASLFIGTGTSRHYHTSHDGVNWTYRGLLPANGGGDALTYLPIAGKFILGSTDDVYSSSDGISWTTHANVLTGFGIYTTSVGVSSSYFFAFSTTSTTIYRSANGSTWTPYTLPSSAGWYSLAHNPLIDRLVLVGSSATNSNIATSDDQGVTWTLRSKPTNVGLSQVIYDNGVFLASGSSSNSLFKSSDGITWDAVNIPSSSNSGVLASGNGMFIIGDAGTIYATYDFKSFTSIATINSISLSAAGSRIAYKGGIFALGKYSSTPDGTESAYIGSMDTSSSWIGSKQVISKAPGTVEYMRIL